MSFIAGDDRYEGIKTPRIDESTNELDSDSSAEITKVAIRQLTDNLRQLGISPLDIAFELTEQAKRLKNYY